MNNATNNKYSIEKPSPTHPKALNIGWGITGSFCTIPEIYCILEELQNTEGVKITPILSDRVSTMDTRVCNSNETLQKMQEICGNKAIVTINQAETIGPRSLFDALIIAPLTGNSLAKLANSICDSTILMAAKAHLRNNKPLILGISTNDGLAGNAENLGKLLTRKNIYFIPFNQDDPQNKPFSLKSNFTQTAQTLTAALQNLQLQPILC